MTAPPLGRNEATEDERAFERYATELTSQLAVAGSLVMTTVTILWWPLDPLVRPDARFVPAFASLRVRVLAVMLSTLVLFAGSSWVRARSLVLAPLCYAALLLGIGYSLGQLGGPDLSWLADSFVGVLPSALIPLRLRPRVVMTSALGLALAGGFFLPFPENRAAPGALGQASFLLFAVVLTVVAGELGARLLRRSFYQQRALERANAQLGELSATLSAKVSERTRELRSLAQHLEGVQEAERRRIARELHDDLGQSLTAMRFTLTRLQSRVEARPELALLVDDLSALVEGTSASMRGIVSELRPRVLDELGLVAAAEWLQEKVSRAAEARCALVVEEGFPDGCAAPEAGLSLALFRALQEGTTNALKHAGAARLELRLAVRQGCYVAEVKDDGAGFRPEDPAEGFGLLGLRERLRAVGGALEVRAAPGKGCCLVASVPIPSSRGGDPEEGSKEESP